VSLYALVVFVHVVAASLLFVALGAESVAVGALRRARAADEARLWAGLLAWPARLGPPAMLTVLASGAWMMATAWGPRPWLTHAVGAVVAMVVVGAALTLPRLRRLRVALVGGAWAPTREPRLTASLRLRLAIAVGLLALMTLKPGAAGSSAIVVVALVAGALSALPLRRATGAPPSPVTTG
jgi:hypothetical protein